MYKLHIRTVYCNRSYLKTASLPGGYSAYTVELTVGSTASNELFTKTLEVATNSNLSLAKFSVVLMVVMFPSSYSVFKMVWSVEFIAHIQPSNPPT